MSVGDMHPGHSNSAEESRTKPGCAMALSLNVPQGPRDEKNKGRDTSF